MAPTRSQLSSLSQAASQSDLTMRSRNGSMQLPSRLLRSVRGRIVSLLREAALTTSASTSTILARVLLWPPSPSQHRSPVLSGPTHAGRYVLHLAMPSLTTPTALPSSRGLSVARSVPSSGPVVIALYTPFPTLLARLITETLGASLRPTAPLLLLRVMAVLNSMRSGLGRRGSARVRLVCWLGVTSWRTFRGLIRRETSFADRYFLERLDCLTFGGKSLHAQWGLVFRVLGFWSLLLSSWADQTEGFMRNGLFLLPCC